MYRVIKNIGGRRYAYDQRTWRENGKVKTKSIYVGPVDGEGGGILNRREKRKEQNLAADLDHALVMVARMTGRSVEDQEAAMEVEFADGGTAIPEFTVAATFAAPGDVAGTQSQAAASAEADANRGVASDASDSPGDSAGSNAGSGDSGEGAP